MSAPERDLIAEIMSAPEVEEPVRGSGRECVENVTLSQGISKYDGKKRLMVTITMSLDDVDEAHSVSEKGFVTVAGHSKTQSGGWFRLPDVKTDDGRVISPRYFTGHRLVVQAKVGYDPIVDRRKTEE